MGYITYPRTSGRGSDEKKALELIRLIESLLNGFIEVGLSEIQYLLVLIDWSKLSVATRRKLLRLLNLLLEKQDRILRELFLNNKKKDEQIYDEFQALTKLLEAIATKISTEHNIIRSDDFQFGHDTPAEVLNVRDSFIYTPNLINDFCSHDLRVLYRAMSHEEYEKIILTNQWSNTPETMEGKWFAESYRAAKVWGSKMNTGTDSFMIAEVVTHANMVEKMHHENDLDTQAPARFAQLDRLNKYTKIIKANEVIIEQPRKNNLCFLVILEWIPRQNGGRATTPTSVYYCTTTVMFANNPVVCSIRVDIDPKDGNKACLYFFFEEFCEMIKLHDRLVLLEGSRIVGYVTVIDIRNCL